MWKAVGGELVLLTKPLAVSKFSQPRQPIAVKGPCAQTGTDVQT